MDEAKRFMRYALPGMVVFLLFILAILSTQKYALDTTLSILKSKESGAVIGGVAATFLTSGALGYMFSTIYFLLKQKFMGLDHRPAIHTLINIGYRIDYYHSICENKYPINTNSVSMQDALLFVNSWWWYIKGFNSGVKEIDSYINRLSDAIHSLGATLVGSLLCNILWLIMIIDHDILAAMSMDGDGYITESSSVIIWLILNLILLLNYIGFRNYLQKYTNTVFISAIENNPRMFPKYKRYKFIIK